MGYYNNILEIVGNITLKNGLKKITFLTNLIEDLDKALPNV
jgi:hypothetical protein